MSESPQIAQKQEPFDPPDARFRVMFDTAAVGIGMMGLDRKLIDANPALCKMFGLPREELIGQTPVVVTFPEDYQASTNQFRDLLSGKVDSFWGERRYQRKNGEVFWAHVTMSMVRDAEGKPLYIIGMLVDIDERKRAMLELHESVERFRAMFDSSVIGMGLLGLDGKILRVNAAVCKMSGYTEEELKQRYDYENIYPEDCELGRTEYEELISGKRESFEVARRYVHKSGRVFWTRLSFAPVRDAQGKIQYLVGMIADIDEEKRILAELQESEARFRGMFESAAMGVVILDTATLTMRINSAARAILDDPNLERTLNSIYEIVHDDYQEAEHELVRDLVEGRRDSYEAEHRYQRPGQEPSWVHVTFSAVRDTTGQLRHIVVMLKDITKQNKIQQNLVESEARFRTMFDNVSVGMAMVSLDRRILAINRATEQIIGCYAEELIGTSPSDLAHPEDRLIGLEQFRALVGGQLESFQMEKRYVRKNGEIFWARVTYASVRGPEGQPQYLVGSIEDINEQKLVAEKLAAQEAEYRRTLEQRVEERTRELREANLRLVSEIEQRQRVEETLASKAVEEAIVAERTRLARDLHDAVTQTLFSASLIAEVLPELWEVDANEARKSNEELRQLTRGALAEMRTLLLELRPAALTQARFPDLLKQLSEAVTGRARLPVELVVEGTYELPPDVKVAFYRITQESLNNIVKYARATRVVIKIRLDCCNVHLEVKDNGTGFDLSSVKPTSLGMRIMRERAEAIHAHFSVTSAPGQGTTVSVDWNEDELIPIKYIQKRGEP